MPEKMTIDKIRHKGPVTYITTKAIDGQITRHMICWWTPSNKSILKALKNGDTLVTDPIARIVQQP